MILIYASHNDKHNENVIMSILRFPEVSDGTTCNDGTQVYHCHSSHRALPHSLGFFATDPGQFTRHFPLLMLLIPSPRLFPRVL